MRPTISAGSHRRPVPERDAYRGNTHNHNSETNDNDYGYFLDRPAEEPQTLISHYPYNSHSHSHSHFLQFLKGRITYFFFISFQERLDCLYIFMYVCTGCLENQPFCFLVMSTLLYAYTFCIIRALSLSSELLLLLL